MSKHQRQPFLRRNAVLACICCCPVSICLSVRPSQAGTVSKWLDESSWFLAWKWKLPSTYPIMCYNEILSSPKLGYFPLEFCSKLYRKFCHGKSIVLSTKLVIVVDSQACWQHLYDNRWVMVVYYKSVNCNPRTTLLQFVVDLLYNLFLQLTSFDWQHIARSICSSRLSCLSC